MRSMDMVGSGGTSADARIHGDTSRQVVVGNKILQNNLSHGAVVYVAAPGQTPAVRRRCSPVQLAGWAEPPLLSRESELAEVASGLQVAGVVQVYGTRGAGKTSLLKSVVHAPPDTAADGVVYHAALGEPVDDVMQSLFETFNASDVPFKPTDIEIRHAMQLVIVTKCAIPMYSSRSHGVPTSKSYRSGGNRGHCVAHIDTRNRRPMYSPRFSHFDARAMVGLGTQVSTGSVRLGGR